MSDDIVHVIFGATVLILWRLDRLGRQLEAVCANIKINLATTQERSDFFLNEWKENRHQTTKIKGSSSSFGALSLLQFLFGGSCDIKKEAVAPHDRVRIRYRGGRAHPGRAGVYQK